MNVLVIGGTRFLGIEVVSRLLAARHAVTLFNRGRQRDPFGDRVERLRGDRTSSDLASLLTARRFDAAVDLVAFTGADARGAIEALADRVGHYLLVSTGQVYLVRREARLPSREEDYDGPLVAEPAAGPDREQWQYGIGKREAEDALAAAFRERSFPATALRLPMINGVGDYRRRLESYFWRILDGGPVLVPAGDDRPVRHVYAPSVARAVVGLLGDRRTFGRAYNLAQDEAPPLRALLELVADRLGAPARLTPVPPADIASAGLDVEAVSPFSSRWMSFLDPSRARTELGFRHRPLAEYVEAMVDAFLARPPAEPPESYRGRARERALAGGR